MPQIKVEEMLEIHHQILTEREIEENLKKLKIDNDNKELEKEFQCSICKDFAHEPINCVDCDFKACSKCFEVYKHTKKSSKCP